MVKKIKSKKDILKVFEINSWKTIKQVSKEMKLSYQPTYMYLSEMAKEGFLNHKREGNVHFYSLNLKNREVIREIENFEFEKSQNLFKGIDKKVCSSLNEFIENIKKEISAETILIYGSVARGSMKKRSDIDIFIVGDDEDKIKRISRTISMKYNLNISSVVVSLEEFRNMLIERNKFTQNLLDEKIVLYGFEFFYNELIKSMERLRWI